MAILRGFPASNTIGPGVRIAEKDLSLILPAVGAHKAGLVGFSRNIILFYRTVLLHCICKE